MHTLRTAAVIAVALSPAIAQDSRVEVRFAQRDYLVSYRARAPGSGFESQRSYYDVMLHSFALVNKGDGDLRIEKLFVELLRGGEVVQRTRIPDGQVRSSLVAVRPSVQMAKTGSRMFLDVPFGHRRLFRAGEQVATTPTLKPNSGLIINDVYLVIHGEPHELRVTATLRGENGAVSASGSIAVRNQGAKNRYTFPLEPGRWFVFADSLLATHHRFTQGTEFAIDITQLGRDGLPYSGTGRKWSDWHAYGKKVLAAAPGKVIKVVAHSKLDPQKFSRKEGETVRQFRNRIGLRQRQRFLAAGNDPLEVAGGNYIVIAHDKGEFSQYLHLAHGSIRVKEGDQVEVGQHIAGVGGTGELPWVHLHFQVTDAYDPKDPLSMTTAHSLPVRFSNAIRSSIFSGGTEPGRYVVVRKR